MSLASTTAPGAIGGSNRLPNGWALDPAGTQVNTQRAPTGLTVSPDGQSVYAVTSGIFEEAVESVGAGTLVAAPTPVGSAYQGVASDTAGHVWVSGGPDDRVFEYLSTAPGAPLVDARAAGPAPQGPNRGIPVTGDPGNMVLDPVSKKLFVAGNLSVPDTVALSASGSHCPRSEAYTFGGKPDTICSVVNVVDVSDPSPGTSPRVTAVPVGRDAYGLAYLPAGPDGGTLYVSNWADQTNPGRTGAPNLSSATGTVSVVHVAGGRGYEQQVVPVGKGPAGIALSPDHKMLVVANSADDTVSVLPLSSSGSVETSHTTSPLWAGIGPAGSHLGTQPLAVSFSPDGRYVFAALAQIDALEIFRVRTDASGTEQLAPIEQRVTVDYLGRRATVTSPGTYVPTGWYPDALAVGPEPSSTGVGAEPRSSAPSAAPGGQAGFRLYLANLKGNGAGPGYYGQLQPAVGTGTEGTLSAIDVPSSSAPGALERALHEWTAKVVQGDRLAPVFDRALSNPAANACLGVSVPGSPGPVDSRLLCEAQRGKLDARSLHVVFILAENKTFDSYFGDTAGSLDGNAFPGFTEYPQPVTTNQHRLADQFTVSDDFWNEGAESSVVGHSWWSAGITTPDRELTWGQDYDQGLRGGRSGGQYAPATSANPTGFSLSGPSDPAVGRQESLMVSPYATLADRAGSQGFSTRVYGTDTSPLAQTPSVETQVDQREWGEGPRSPVSTDLGFPDSDRADIFLHGTTISHAWDVAEGQLSPPATYGRPMSLPRDETSTSDPSRAYTLDGWDAIYRSCMNKRGATDSSCQATSMPNFTYMQLPENHTYDVSNVFNPLDPTPQSMVADNDYAIGKVVSGLSKSPFWKNTVVFLSEDDNQFTGDHVDIHRTFLLTTGGLAEQHGLAHQVSHQQGSFPSALKTAEVLLGLEPLTLFDWTATPLHDVIANAPDTSASAAYDVVVPPTPFLGGQPRASALAAGSLPGAGSAAVRPRAPSRR